eukprot:CAMPEP_0183519962 /NCGR_PEP_ID=MMETSP0371-20130417/16544_1 /TAXON_ID=268820 /ORGANISM="Peridinium aciculiferum, Strain PAER-2" /LENGTH=56 /DNA_ID=CAMNT_0025718231 /DNA_START=127 /DNA_END=295 /DNA_ORIENTATION=+
MCRNTRSRPVQARNVWATKTVELQANVATFEVVLYKRAASGRVEIKAGAVVHSAFM